MADFDPNIEDALYDLIAAERSGSYDGGDVHAHVRRIARRYAQALKAAKAEAWNQGWLAGADDQKNWNKYEPGYKGTKKNPYLDIPRRTDDQGSVGLPGLQGEGHEGTQS